MTNKSLETLKPSTRTWVRRVLMRWKLEDHHERILLLAGQAWDRCQQAKELLDAEGLTITTHAGVKTHPAAQIERDSRLQFARLIRELQLDADAPEELRTPPLY